MQANKLLIRGIVQGVGFRATVFRVANGLGIKGWVRNTSEGVEVVINTLSNKLFLLNLDKHLPRLARIDSISEEIIELANTPNSFIIESSNTTNIINNTMVPEDSCICQECITDLFDPKSKYYLYPFTNCSNCGPRYTVIKNLPYDRDSTALADFDLCNDCLDEFTDPLNRRYHAQTTSCPKCGPHLDMDLADIATQIQDGNIVALKTTGGYTLIANANNAATVEKLRERKQRKTKPFALMALNSQSINDYFCQLNLHQQQLLESKSSPIVILTKHHSAVDTFDVAPNLNTLGFMLPSSPIYYLLFYYLLGRPGNHDWMKQSHPLALIVTSANLSGGSIIYQDFDAKKSLSAVADIVVGYNREIVMQCDDSVILPINEQEIIIRRARGLVPKPYLFNYKMPQVLGLGAHLKNTLCFTRDKHAYVSQYLGDMGSQDTLSYFHKVLLHYQKMFNFTPELLVSDLHPDFYTTTYANEYGVPHLQLQHHYAHFASTMASAQSYGRELNQNLIGCILDGYGYGSDGSSWGGELIKFNLADLSFTRLSHLPLISVQGGDSAEREPWKLALTWCLEHNVAIPKHIACEPQFDLVSTLIKNKQSITQTSSAGRLFSLVSALLGICCHSSYEAEAALKLESMVTRLEECDTKYIRLTKDGQPNIASLIEHIYHIAHIEGNLVKAVNIFYANLAALLEKWIIYHASLLNISQVAFSGGCWQSRYLLPLLKKKLSLTGIDLLLPYQIPFNDECISFGQAWYGAQHLLLNKGELCV